MKYLLITISWFFVSQSIAQQTYPLNTWIDHLPYKAAQHVEQSAEKVFVATPVSLYSINKSDYSIEKISKCTGLSDIGFSALTYDDSHGILIIAYDNSNIDLWSPTQVINIPDIKRKNLVGDKRPNLPQF